MLSGQEFICRNQNSSQSSLIEQQPKDNTAVGLFQYVHYKSQRCPTFPQVVILLRIIWIDLYAGGVAGLCLGNAHLAAQASCSNPPSLGQVAAGTMLCMALQVGLRRVGGCLPFWGHPWANTQQYPYKSPRFPCVAHGLAAGAQLHVLYLTQRWQTCVLQESAVPGQPGTQLNKRGYIE